MSLTIRVERGASYYVEPGETRAPTYEPVSLPACCVNSYNERGLCELKNLQNVSSTEHIQTSAIVSVFIIAITNLLICLK